MKTYLDCVPCFFKQALQAARLAGVDVATQKKVLDELARNLESFNLDWPPPVMGRVIYGLVRKITGKDDPYFQIKQESNRLALGAYAQLKQRVARSKDPLLIAVELAIAGNIIDYGVKHSLNVTEELAKILSQERQTIKGERERFFNYNLFCEKVKDAEFILYLADNAGEIVFDKILIEQINKQYPDKKIIYAVKGEPIINDALIKDALDCGLNKVATLISSGCDTPGTVTERCSKEFNKIYHNAPLIIAKGQGNFEALSGAQEPIFFLFMAKCMTVVKDIGCNLRDIILFFNKS
jgi:hypothetical protein